MNESLSPLFRGRAKGGGLSDLGARVESRAKEGFLLGSHFFFLIEIYVTYSVVC